MRYAGLLLIFVLPGCATPPHVNPQNHAISDSPSISPPVAPSVAPAKKPSTPPDDPTDRIKPTTSIVGTVTTGGTGPCYGLVTDEGKQYALHSTAGLTLTKGGRVQIKTQPARVRIYCGPGTLLELTAAEPLR